MTEEYNIMVNSVELIDSTTERLTLRMACCIIPYCYNHVQQYTIKYETNIAYTPDRGLKIWYQHTNNKSACFDACVLVIRTIKYYTQQNANLMESETDYFTKDTQFLFLIFHAQTVFCY
jgi:hypothetical protein